MVDYKLPTCSEVVVLIVGDYNDIHASRCHHWGKDKRVTSHYWTAPELYVYIIYHFVFFIEDGYIIGIKQKDVGKHTS